MKKIFRRIKNLALKHKIISLIFIAAIAYAGYWGYQKFGANSGQTQYVTAIVRKGAVIVSITGSGQVAASGQSDIKPKASGEITGVYATPGQEAIAGTLLAIIDSTDAERTARDAETSLETAKLELDKLLEPADELTLLQAENSLAQTKESKQKAEDDLKKAYEDGFNAVAGAFLELPGVMTSLQEMLFESTLGTGGQWNIDYYEDAVKAYDEKVSQYKENARLAYQTARTAYDKNFADYKSTSRFAGVNTIESLIGETYDTTKEIAEAVKSANNLIQFYQDKLTERKLKPNSLSNTHLSTLNANTVKTNNNLSSLLSIQRTIQNSKEAIINAKRSTEEKELSLAKIKKGPDDLDIRAKKINIRQKEDMLSTAKQTLADHYVRAPFSGVIAKVNAKKGDSASAGAAIATLVTKQKIAEISLNEIDAAKIKVGQKSTLTFDAVDGLSIDGKVTEIDAVGTVAQGVVTYNVKIAFDIQDDRVKPGMSASAAIITDAAQDVLLVPISAIKSQGETQYVEIFDQAIPRNKNGQGIPSPVPPRQQIVETGLSNDTFVEIISGLKEGDQVVSRTINGSSASQSVQQAPSLFGNIGGNRGGSGNRIPR